jgi:hypothetical protein
MWTSSRRLTLKLTRRCGERHLAAVSLNDEATGTVSGTWPDAEELRIEARDIVEESTPARHGPPRGATPHHAERTIPADLSIPEVNRRVSAQCPFESQPGRVPPDGATDLLATAVAPIDDWPARQ